MKEMRSSINVAAKRSGVSAHVIRKWEERYDAVRPERTGTKRRLYSEGDIERLEKLRLLTREGHRISDIAPLSTEKLAELSSRASVRSGEVTKFPDDPSAHVARAMEAVAALEAEDLESVLEKGAVAFGTQGLLQHVIGPLAKRIGESWAGGLLTAGHEHFATETVRSFLQRRFRAFVESETSPLLVVGTPAGQLHELGTAIVAAAARERGWRVVCLGASLPAAEIANVVIAKGARALALSIVYPRDDEALPDELRFLRKLLPPEVAIIAGGRAADAYGSTLHEIGAVRADDLAVFATFLDSLRAVPPGGWGRPAASPGSRLAAKV